MILAAYTFENVRLLLLSTSERFPRGLANGHGQVGRYFVPKQFPRIYGLLPGVKANRFTGPGAQADARRCAQAAQPPHPGDGAQCR